MDIKIIENLSGITNLDAKVTFDKLCDYIIGFFDPEGHAIEGWTFPKEVNDEFRRAAATLVKEYQKGIEERGWCDPLGSTFEQLLGKFDAGNKGQFFTPECVCDLMADIALTEDEELPGPTWFCGAFGRRHIASDPSAGSGRNLLAIASKYAGKPRKDLPYFVAEDIDPLCCKMSAINLMAHGLPGEVICHNTLEEPDMCKFGYIINETTYPFYTRIPSIRRSTNPLRFVTLRQRYHE